MPELPEVETVRAGLEPVLIGRRIGKVEVRCAQLRYPVPADLAERLSGARVLNVKRRAKYLLIETGRGHLLVHLGMSGTVQIVGRGDAPQKHDHVDIGIGKGQIMRFRDPRRFGAVLWIDGDPLAHKLLAHLGPEPLLDGFTGEQMWTKARKRRAAIKVFLMDSKIVVGVGNIYASESLWRAGIHPKRAVGRVSKVRMEKLVECVREVLAEAIAQGGTTLNDFKQANGELGYFAQDLAVYGREGEPCLKCKTPIQRAVLGQRSTFWCSGCQG
ncbi:MAG: bifunctional DNA-formamidopyrimidine glycosylase/DNA-(apurinic or apyrimidinic site) lyase [Planctomycetes bacterium]|nr:bifunctional DNA-formamidopyrimidine glycosylase/DNA-(apurinic or apyrimidinic site) lyase [Planctomycetota bacterium]